MDYNKYMFEKTSMTINDYPEKKLIVADIIRHTDDKNILRIIDSNTDEVLYDDRCEYIKWTSEGCASSLCSREIESIDTFDDKIELYVDMQKGEKHETFENKTGGEV